MQQQQLLPPRCRGGAVRRLGESDPVPLCCQDIILTVKEKLSIRSIEYFALALEEQYSVSRLHLLHEEELIQQVGGPTCSGAAKLLDHIRAGVFCTHSAWG